MNTPARVRRERAKVERRASILRAATRVFSERGLAAATMDEVARKAGVSKGAVYLYFQSKDELYLEIATQAISDLVSSLKSIDVPSSGNGLLFLRRLVVRYVEHALSDMGRFTAGISWLTTGYAVDDTRPPFREYQARIAELHDFCARAVARGQADQSVPFSGPPNVVAVQIWAAALGLILVEHRSDELRRRVSDLPSLEGMALDFLDRLLGVEPHASHLKIAEHR